MADVISALKDTMDYSEHSPLPRCAGCSYGDFDGAQSDGICTLNGAVNFTVLRDAACSFFEET